MFRMIFNAIYAPPTSSAHHQNDVLPMDTILTYL
ncbi:hypothetical protein T4D_722 [Trichinella pseudospiralis]|uniref:Uncharacterized protein n=1 Tax=Trichinella pseudospiralis TaxID=6337 RepID=A0A0V1F2R1_TRIPS|nr:hypothetical protein T4D_722 [Trichinella pseudospiralis]